MAGASAKKASVARKEASDIYLPLLGVVNVVYLLIRWWTVGFSFRTWSEMFGLLCIAGLQAFAYVGILENAANRSAPTFKDKKSLVGGASLDVLGLTVLIQFLAVLWTPKVYWMLLIFPIWGIYYLYQTFWGGVKATAATATSRR